MYKHTLKRNEASVFHFKFHIRELVCHGLAMTPSFSVMNNCLIENRTPDLDFERLPLNQKL